MSTEIDILEKVRARLTDPSHFCQGAMARNGAGKAVTPVSPDAVCWCFYGALFTTVRYPESISTSVLGELHATSIRLFQEPPAQVSESPDGHANVLRIIDETIADYKAREATHDA